MKYNFDNTFYFNLVFNMYITVLIKLRRIFNHKFLIQKYFKIPKELFYFKLIK